MTDIDLHPRLALRVGVTGHRHLDRTNLIDLRFRVGKTLADVAEAMEKVARTSPRAYAQTPVLLRAVSPLAEGVDRIFAEEALNLGYKLDCPLPFEREEYCATFEGGAAGVRATQVIPATSDSARQAAEAIRESVHAFKELLKQAETILEMDGRRVTGGNAYKTVGRVVLDQSDILVAIWNGESAAGKGGTENIVRLARRRQIPILCLRTDSMPDTLILEGHPRDCAVLNPDVIEDVVRSLTQPPWGPGAGEDENGGYTASRARGSSFLGALWSAFENILSRGVKYRDTPNPTRSANALCDPFEQQYRRFSEHAKCLGGLYRGAFLTNYVLGVLAVLLALLSYSAPEHRLVWGILEFAAIISVLFIVGTMRRHRWHHRTVDCRYLVEQFRILRYVYPLGLSAPALRLPAHFLHSDQKSWMEWRLRAILRQTPMPSNRLTPSHVDDCHAAILYDWVASQIRYHERNTARLQLMEHRLHWLGEQLFYLAAVACVMHLICEETGLAPWLTFLAAGSPAAAAACHAISTQGEFRRLADRSASMSQSLQKVSEQLRDLKVGRKLNGANLRKSAEQVAQVMLEEVVDWQVLYKKPAPPAG